MAFGSRLGESALAPRALAGIDRHHDGPQTKPAPAAFLDSAKGNLENVTRGGTLLGHG
jgi:hypothetical protein